MDEADREARDAQQAVRGVLRVAAPVTFGAMHLGAVVACYLEKFPDVTVETLLDDRYIDLLAENVDVAIRIGRLLDSDLVARKLAPCRMVFCASPAFLDRHGHPSTVEALRRMPRLAFSGAVSPGDWTVHDGDGRPVTIDGPLRLTANNTQMLLAAALAGAGVAYGPSFVFGEAITAGRLIALLADHHKRERPCRLLTRSGLRTVDRVVVLMTLAACSRKAEQQRISTGTLRHCSTANMCHSPGTPLRDWLPRSPKRNPEPATRSFTVLDTNTSPAPASAATRAPM